MPPRARVIAVGGLPPWATTVRAGPLVAPPCMGDRSPLKRRLINTIKDSRTNACSEYDFGTGGAVCPKLCGGPRCTTT